MCSFLLAVVAKMLLALGSAKAALALCLLGVLTTEHPADSTTAATTVTDWTDEPRDTETVARFDPTEDQELAGAREVDTTEPPPDTEAGKGTTVVETPEAKAAREKEAAGKDKTDEAETTGDLVSDFYLKGVKPPADTATPSTTTDPFTPLSAKIKKVGPERVAAALVEAGFDKAEAEALVNAPTGAGKLAVEVGELRKSSDTVKKAQTALATFVTFDDKGELASFDGNNVFLTACKALGVKKVVEDFSQGTDYTIVPKAYLASLQAGGANGNGQAARATAALEVAKALKLDERLKETGAEIDLATATAQQVRDLVHQFGDAEDQYLDRVEALKREQATAGDRQAAAEQAQLQEEREQYVAALKRYRDPNSADYIPFIADLEPIIVELAQSLHDKDGKIIPAQKVALLKDAALGRHQRAHMAVLVPRLKAEGWNECLTYYQLPGKRLAAGAALPQKQQAKPRGGVDTTTTTRTASRFDGAGGD